jgi:Luciferase-like monooxygenase
MIPLSALDLSPIVQGGTPALAFRHTLELAQHAERRGYTRFWLAEHHNMPGIGRAATAVLIAQRHVQRRQGRIPPDRPRSWRDHRGLQRHARHRTEAGRDLISVWRPRSKGTPNQALQQTPAACRFPRRVAPSAAGAAELVVRQPP